MIDIVDCFTVSAMTVVVYVIASPHPVKDASFGRKTSAIPSHRHPVQGCRGESGYDISTKRCISDGMPCYYV
jgi:hypothetical protein